MGLRRRVRVVRQSARGVNVLPRPCEEDARQTLLARQPSCTRSSRLFHDGRHRLHLTSIVAPQNDFGDGSDPAHTDVATIEVDRDGDSSPWFVPSGVRARQAWSPSTAVQECVRLLSFDGVTDVPYFRPPDLPTSHPPALTSSRPPVLPISQSPGLPASRPPDVPTSRPTYPVLPTSRLPTFEPPVLPAPASRPRKRVSRMPRKRPAPIPLVSHATPSRLVEQ